MPIVSKHLMDMLTEAVIDAPADNYVAVQRISIGRETRMSIFQHPVSRIKFPRLQLGRHTKIKFGIGIKEASWSRIESPVEFTISVIDARTRTTQVFKQLLDVNIESNRRFFDLEIDLSRFDKQQITLQFETGVPDGGSIAHAWSGWCDPILETDIKLAPPLKSTKRYKNVLFVITEALRADHLGCYGHPNINTPNIDALAREGILFSQARANTSTSLGSLASIYTGLHVYGHGIDAEWGEPDPSLPNLAKHFRNNGYYSVLAVSEREHEGQGQAMTNWFDELIPCLGMPAQSGDISSRRFINWLDQRPDKPFFYCLQYFDTHPPSLLPSDYSKMYYRGDPTNKLASFQAEKVPMIHAVETALEFEIFLEGINHGVTNTHLAQRLASCANALMGKSPHGPDLAPLLRQLGPKPRKGLDEHNFGEWLLSQSSILKNGVATPELISWMKDVLPYLHEVEKEIISFLSEVVDFRFALSQYSAGVTYLDAQIGTLVAALKEREIYDDTTIVFCSPHGELLGEHGMVFHHLAFTEEVAKVPLIIKPSSNWDGSKGMVMDTMIDIIDLFPTICESAGIELSEKIDGKSLWSSLRNHCELRQNESFGMSQFNTFAVLARPPYVFIKALNDLYMSETFHWKKNQTGLFRIQTPMSYSVDLSGKEPEISKLLADRMERWLCEQMKLA